MRIELDKLGETGGQFEHRYEPEELVLDEEHVRLLEPPRVSGRISLSDHQIRLRGTLRARAEVDCDRCLKAVAVPVETSFDVRYVPSVEFTAASEAAELQEEDLSLSAFDGDAIDVDDLVREQMLLALPTRALCREECHGLCPVCGADRNTESCACEEKETDPRWAALKNFRF
jgi:uncharacterized protein